MRNSLLYVVIRAIINEPERKEEYKELKDQKRGVSNLHNSSYVLDELTEMKQETTVWRAEEIMTNVL
jgi:hypothetical protein